MTIIITCCIVGLIIKWMTLAGINLFLTEGSPYFFHQLLYWENITRGPSGIAQEKVKTFKETVSFHLASNHSNFWKTVYMYIPTLPAGHLITSLMNTCGHYGKIQPQILTNHSMCYIFTSSSHIIIFCQ